MAVYVFKGKNRAGNIVEGERVAKTEKEAIELLSKEQIQILSLQKKKTEIKIPFLSGGERKKKVSLRDLAVFNRQLSVMFNAGLPITQGIGILATQQDNKYFAKALEDIRKDVEGGSNFSNSLKKYPDIFSDLYTSMIQAGEASGNLDTILLRLSQYIENMSKLVGKVKSAMAYPIAVLIIAVVLTAVIMLKVVPVFEDMFAQLGAALPVPTQIVINFSHFMASNIVFITIAGIGLFFAFKFYYGTFKGRRTVDRFKLKIWIIGGLLQKVAVARVTRTLSTLLSSGVEMIEAITITAKTAGNTIIEDAILKSRLSVQEGKPLWQAWEEAKIFPFMVTQMVSVGEETGSLSTMLSKIADFYDEEVDAAVSALISLMEPIMILFLGGLVGSIIVAMYLPMFDIIGKV